MRIGTLEPEGRKHTQFHQDASWLQRLTGRPPLRDPALVVNELLTAFRELEIYWENGKVGRSIRRWPLGRLEEKLSGDTTERILCRVRA